MVLASEAVKNRSYAKRLFFWKRERKQLKGTVAFFFFLIVSAFGQWCSIQTHVVALKNKLRNTWDVIFAAEGIGQLIACDSGVQETNEK